MKVLQIVVPLLGLVLLTACDTDPMLDAVLDNIETAELTGDAVDMVIVSSIGGDRIISDGSVDREALIEVRDNMDLSRAYAKEHLGIDPPGCNVFISADPEWMTDRYFDDLRAEGLSVGEHTWQQKNSGFHQYQLRTERGGRFPEYIHSRVR